MKLSDLVQDLGVASMAADREISFINTALREMAPYIDFISFHEYTHNERDVFEKVETLEAIAISDENRQASI